VRGKSKLITIQSIVIKTEKNICQELWQENKNEIADTIAIVLNSIASALPAACRGELQYKH
jgi:hypothetical protein